MIWLNKDKILMLIKNEDNRMDDFLPTKKLKGGEYRMIKFFITKKNIENVHNADNKKQTVRKQGQKTKQEIPFFFKLPIQK